MKAPWEDESSAPNGRPVKDNFAAWFGRSVVVDSKGRPLTVYHGTDREFAAFDKKHIGANFAADEIGFFFTSDPNMASHYAENDTIGLNKRDGALVIPAYVCLNKPLLIDDKRLRAEGMHPIGVNDDCVTFWDTYQGLILEWAQDARSDGVILVDKTYAPRGEPTRMVVAFEPHQIKSAIGNSGLFLPRSPDLTDSVDSPALAAGVRARAAVRDKASNQSALRAT